MLGLSLLTGGEPFSPVKSASLGGDSAVLLFVCLA